MSDQTQSMMHKNAVQPLDDSSTQNTASNKKTYRAPQLRRLGDFHSMTRTAENVPLVQDFLGGMFYIS